METYFIIYKTTCLITNKFYVGMHKTTNLQDGYLGSGIILKRSVKKYGFENHVFEILEYLPDLDSLIKREREIVNETLISVPSCMNLKIGGMGGGGFWNEEHQRKAQSAAGKAYWNLYSGISLQNLTKGFKNDDPIEKERMLKKMKQTFLKNGKQWSFSGKTHTSETKEKMKKSKANYKGKGHPQFGHIWIAHPDLGTKKIPEDELSKYTQEGWKRGRK